MATWPSVQLGTPTRLLMDMGPGSAPLDVEVDHDDYPVVFVSPTGRGYLVEHARRVNARRIEPGWTRWALSCIRVDVEQQRALGPFLRHDFVRGRP